MDKAEAKHNLERALDDLSGLGGDTDVKNVVINWLNHKLGGSHRIMRWKWMEKRYKPGY